MGLHDRSRTYLYREFVERNYRGIDDIDKEELLTIQPDEILEYKRSLQKALNLQEKMQELLSSFGNGSRGNLRNQIFQTLIQELDPEKLVYYSFDPEEEKARLQFDYAHEGELGLEKQVELGKVETEFKLSDRKRPVLELGQSSDLAVTLFQKNKFDKVYLLFAEKELRGFVLVAGIEKKGVFNLLVKNYLQIFLELMSVLFLQREMISQLVGHKKALDQSLQKLKTRRSVFIDKFGDAKSEMNKLVKMLDNSKAIVFNKNQNEYLLSGNIGFPEFTLIEKLEVNKAFQSQGFLSKDISNHVLRSLPKKVLTQAKNIYVVPVKLQRDNYLVIFPNVAKPQSLLEELMLEDAELLCQYFSRFQKKTRRPKKVLKSTGSSINKKSTPAKKAAAKKKAKPAKKATVKKKATPVKKVAAKKKTVPAKKKK